MRKYGILWLFVFSALLASGQDLPTQKEGLVEQEPPFDISTGPGTLKSGGKIIWGTSFNWKNPQDPKGWTLPGNWTIKDNLNMGNLWVWRDDTLKGLNPASAPSWFNTGSDGFICLPIDEYNSLESVVIPTPADGYIETPPINCTAAPSVVVQFNQYFNFCCNRSSGNIEMLVSTNGFLTWATYTSKFSVDVNTFTPVRFRSVEINISDIAAGLPNVQIRFYMQRQIAYFWMIDDLRLTEAFENDVVLDDFWLEFDTGTGIPAGQISYWPLSQTGMGGTITGTVGSNYFKAALLNNGSKNADNVKLDIKVLKNGNQADVFQSSGKTLLPLQVDTQRISNPYLASGYGDYRVDYKAISDNQESTPANNSGSTFFTINDTLLHRADFSAESSSNTGGFTTGDNAGDMVGVSYDLFAPAEINSITAYLASFKASQAPQFQFVLVKDIDGTKVEWISSVILNMDSSYRHRWVTLPVIKDGETEFLEPGRYIACVKMWGTDPNDPKGSNGLSVGWDLTTKPSNTWLYAEYSTSPKGKWSQSGKLNMIGFSISGSGTPAQAEATFNVDMTRHIASGQFKPGTDFIDLSGTFNNWSGSPHLSDPESDGIYSITLDGMPVGTIIQYKYRINGNWTTAEFSNGGQNRKYTVRYWNVLDDIYNDGNTTGIIDDTNEPSFNVYPNPTSGAFTVEINSPDDSEIVITLTNIQGQVIYQNHLYGSGNHREIIDNKLSKGLYFLVVNTGRGVKYIKVVVQ